MIGFASILSALRWLFSKAERLGGKIADARIELAKAATDKERIAAEERVSRLQAQRDVLIAEQGSWVTRMPRALMGWSAGLYVAKLLVWDKILALGATDPVTGDLRDWMLVIIGGYFLTELRLGGRR